MLKVIELFAGIGSQRKALEKIGINHKIIAFCDNDKYAEKSYRAIFNDYETPNLGDITKLETLPYDDLITWSFPCKDISSANNNGQGLNGKRSGLAYKVIDLIKTMTIKPQYLLMENVPNLLSRKFFVGFQNLQSQLSELGYHNQHFTMNAKDYGIPQNRKRLFMISTLDFLRYPFLLKYYYKIYNLWGHKNMNNNKFNTLNDREWLRLTGKKNPLLIKC
ncbi:DNA cytosine methyltransferase [Spiroplasma poulsonii]|uniref:DNA cytosine methyltransferase n=1 Tax=Spiroplasma poulsonii TaxID=2138 RepID=UPI0026B6F7B4